VRAKRAGEIDAASFERIGAVAAAIVAELEDAPPRSPGPALARDLRALCVPARDTMDAVATRALANELAQRGIDATSASTHELASETTERLQRGSYTVVVVSAVAPTHFLFIRSLCKRFLQSQANLHVVVGLWGEELGAAAIADRLPSSPRLHVAVSLQEAVTAVEGLGASQRVRLPSTGT
jgi:hypothetical protein